MKFPKRIQERNLDRNDDVRNSNATSNRNRSNSEFKSKTNSTRTSQKNQVDEKMKRQNPLLWVQNMNSFKNQAEEIIYQELIYN